MTKLLIVGADVGTLRELEQLGVTFRDGDTPEDLFGILVDNGFNTIRLRLWVDPYDESGSPYLGGTNDLQATLELARRARAHGCKIMLDIHYSDFWADPNKQSMPKAWQGLTGIALDQMVYDYTRSVLTTMNESGLSPDFVQIGNEITNGMLWPEGRTTQFVWAEQEWAGYDAEEDSAKFDRLARLLRSGARATREFAPKSQIILHLDNGGSNKLYRRWFDAVTSRNVDFDIIGLSYYPFWHGTLEELKANLDDLAQRFDKDVLVVETGYGYRVDGPEGAPLAFNAESTILEGFAPTPEGQTKFLLALRDVVTAVPGGHGLGIVYWEPGWVAVEGTSWASHPGMVYGGDVTASGHPWANLVLFDFDGNSLPALAAFREF